MIPEKGKNIYATYTVDREGFIDVSKAIKQTTEKINEIEKTNYEANVYTSFESSGFIKRMSDLDANKWYDGMTIHPYSGTVSGGTNAEAFYDDAMKKAENVGIQNVKNYVDSYLLEKFRLSVSMVFLEIQNLRCVLRHMRFTLRK